MLIQKISPVVYFKDGHTEFGRNWYDNNRPFKFIENFSFIFLIVGTPIYSAYQNGFIGKGNSFQEAIKNCLALLKC